MKWIPINIKKPKLGQKCYCYIVSKRHDGTIYQGTRLLYYLKYSRDERKRVFSEEDGYLHKLNIGEQNWSVTHWMPEPDPPNEQINHD